MRRYDISMKRKYKITMLFMVFAITLGNTSCNETADDILPNEEIPDDNVEIPEDGAGSESIVVIEDEFEQQKIVIAGNLSKNFVVSFFRELDGKVIEFKPTDKSLPIIMEDMEGNEWDVFGNAVNGPDKGKSLTPTKSMIGYWFSIATFYPGTQIYPNADKGAFEGRTITGSDGWTVPRNKVVSGGPGKDGIPAIDSPKFASISETSNKLVVGIKIGNIIKAYPHDILDWHEIVNDKADDKYYSIIYCPLTGTATAWNRNITGTPTTFGVSGLLYNSNIIPYDRKTDSNWSQIKDESIFGDLKSQRPDHLQIVETTLSTWRKMYPNSEILTTQTGYSRSYGRYPYGDYKTSQSLIFNVGYNDDRLQRKERVHAIIINGQARVYRLSSFK